MPLNPLFTGSGPLPFDIQQTTLSQDLLGRFVCNTLAEVRAAQTAGGFSFDAVVIGAGMFGGYFAAQLYRLGATNNRRILVLDAGAYFLPSHAQNLPQQTGGQISAPAVRLRDTGTLNVVWGMPWITASVHPANQGFPGLAYCIGGRSLFWGGWSPQLTSADLAAWPTAVSNYLTTPGVGGRTAYEHAELEMGVASLGPGGILDYTTDYIRATPLHTALSASLTSAVGVVANVQSVADAPLAVQGASPASGLFAFDKFSSCPFLIDAVRDDVRRNATDSMRRIFVVPRAEVTGLSVQGGRVNGVQITGESEPVGIPSTTAVVLANGTIEATRLALLSLGIGDSTFGSPRVGNLMAHARSNVVARVRRSALLAAAPTELETSALIVRGTHPATGRRWHLQVTAADTSAPNSEANFWSMIPDLDLQNQVAANQDPNFVVITFRAIGEMEDDRAMVPNAAKSWIDLSNETDPRTGVRRAFVNLVPTANDMALWTTMDNAAFALAQRVAGGMSLEFWNPDAKAWVGAPPPPRPDGSLVWRDSLGTTHHEAGTLFMGAPGASYTDDFGRLHAIGNVYVVGPAVFPTLGSANPSLTAVALARRTAQVLA
jgi:choline dehydrogenase-like flavoprotein